ncbi:related to flavin-containing monooxygenase [Rhynchosporium agropyri]|uniref:Related to flavin-containing monooxygenase n=1 Tax=Rhynchosporium agropyri TaxID=914238 RepID=A0A1E1K1M1_9HELO|nr:related to flavin-containing monooxygenase [Rhynchosporium agropyri]
MRVGVIGGGPSGLVTLKYLITAHKFHDIEPIEVRLFESRDSIAGTFKYRVYEDSELVSSKYLTTFSDFRCTPDDPDFLSTERYCSYLEAYATFFCLWPHIRLSSAVNNITRRRDGGHLIAYTAEGGCEEWHCDAVAICSGLHVEPYIPIIKGIENIPKVLHSSQFKGRKEFGTGKSVMVLGVGETAMDVSHLAVTSPTTSVTLCHRDGFFYAPKVVPVPIIFGFINKSPAGQRNPPVDTYVMSLFDTAYVHPILQKSMLIWEYYDLFVKRMTQLISVFFCKSGKAMPYISKPYRKPGFFGRIRAALINVPIPETGDRTIDLAPWPEFISPDGIVTFLKNDRPEANTMRNLVCKPDIVVFATGYLPTFPYLEESYGTPYQADRRGIWKSGDESVGFIGFSTVDPVSRCKCSKTDSFFEVSELQAQLWVLSILGRLGTALPRDIDYKLHVKPGRREYEQFGVDHESYAYQLALDMGSAPAFREVLHHGYKTTFTWAFGSNFNTKFRLVGPWKWDGAKEIMRTELYDIVNNSGGWVCITAYSIIPFIVFGLMSAMLWIVSVLVALMKAVANRFDNTARSIQKKCSLQQRRKEVEFCPIQDPYGPLRGLWSTTAHSGRPSITEC